MKLEVVNPAALGAPRGYSNGVVVPAGARLLFVAGQIGWDAERRFPDAPGADGFVAQLDRALENVVAVVREAGGEPSSIARVTAYVTDKREYLARTKEVGAAWRARLGRWYPAMALVEVKSLLEDGAKVEIEAVAVLPEPRA